MSEIKYRKMKPGEEDDVSRMVLKSFDRFVAPGYLDQDVELFYQYAHPQRLAERSRANHFILVALDGEKPVGMIEMRDFKHVAMFYVDIDYLQSGIGKMLFKKALAICLENIPDLKKISVLSSPYAVPIYEKLGFYQTNLEEYKTGMQYIPMVREL